MIRALWKVALILTALISGTTVDAESPESALNRERLEVGQRLVEVTDPNDQDILSHYTEDFVYKDPIVLIEGFAEWVLFLNALLESHSDYLLLVEEEVAVNDTYMATWTMRGFFVLW